MVSQETILIVHYSWGSYKNDPIYPSWPSDRNGPNYVSWWGKMYVVACGQEALFLTLNVTNDGLTAVSGHPHHSSTNCLHLIYQ